MNCITTFVTDDYFQFYIPTFVYSANKVMPNVKVIIFVQGQLDGRLHPVQGAEIVSAAFCDYPPCPSILRYLVPDKYFSGMDRIYFTDVDFVFLPHENKTLFDYHEIIIQRSKTCYAGHRGPYNARKYPWKIWDGKYKRIAAGAFMATQDWLKTTRFQRDKILAKIKRKGLAYREQDEVYLCRICQKSKLETPEVVGHFISGNKYNIAYRDIHLGDFKFQRRRTDTQRMKRKFLTIENANKYLNMLENDKEYRSAIILATQNKIIAQNLKYAEKYVRSCY